jgi:hypothetical protein
MAGKKFKMCIRVILKIPPKEKFKTGGWLHDLKNLMDYMKNYFSQQHIIIGNSHESYTDGYITRILMDLWPSDGDTWSLIDLSNTFVVIGSELVICHAEHPTVKKQISRDKALLVSIERGSLNKGIDD